MFRPANQRCSLHQSLSLTWYCQGHWRTWMSSTQSWLRGYHWTERMNIGGLLPPYIQYTRLLQRWLLHTPYLEKKNRTHLQSNVWMMLLVVCLVSRYPNTLIWYCYSNYTCCMLNKSPQFWTIPFVHQETGERISNHHYTLILYKKHYLHWFYVKDICPSRNKKACLFYAIRESFSFPTSNISFWCCVGRSVVEVVTIDSQCQASSSAACWLADGGNV